MRDIRRVLQPLYAMLATRERRQLLALALLALLGAIVEALSIGAVFPFIALLSSPESITGHPAARSILERLGNPSAERVALVGAVVLLALYVLKNLFLAGLYAFQSRVVCDVESRLGVALLSGYLRAPYTDRLSRNSADRIRIVTGEVGRVTVGVMLALIALFSEMLVVAAIGLMLILARPLVALVAFVIVGAVAVLMQTIFRKRLDNYRESRVTTLSSMFRWVNEGLGALKEVKVLGREEYVIGEFRRNSERYAHGTYVFTTLNLLPRIIFETAAVTGLMVAVILTVLVGKALADIVPTVTVFGLAAVRLLPSSSRIVASLNTLRYYAPAVDAVSADLPLVNSISSTAAAVTSAENVRKPFEFLRLNDVSFRYPGSAEFSVRTIHLDIRKGETIAIVGRSGSGKTTLADLLLGLLEPTDGSVEINGRMVGSLREEWRGVAGLVPQEFFLLDDTVRRNVAFGLPDQAIDDARVWHALRMARLDERVRSLPKGLDSPVGERGGTLSGGERQRLGIARALYTDPDILVLDEATSALDAATEAEFVGVLRSLHGEKTIIAITHRAATASWCDRVLVMSSGRIVADGEFDKIKRTNNVLAELSDRPADRGLSGDERFG
jgi:ABC-type multidrug transport system fused ATPase/permease subunit